MAANALPTELVLELASYLDCGDASYTHLALTCRQFYIILIPQLLAYEAKYVRDDMIPTKKIDIYQSTTDEEHRLKANAFDTVDALFMGTYRKIEIDCSIAAMARAGPKDFRCARRIILRAPNLELVTLHVEPMESVLGRLVSYINVCAGRPNITLTISHTRGVYTPNDIPGFGGRSPSNFLNAVELSLKMKGIFNPFLTSAHRLLGSRSSSNSSNPMDVGAGAKSSLDVHHQLIYQPLLSSLAIENDNLLLSLIAPGVKTLLKGAPITRLSISHASMNSMPLSERQWTHLLPSLKLSTLTHLSLINLAITFQALLAFLKGHPRITDLTLDLPKAKRLADEEFPSDVKLLHLTSLAATPNVLVPFIQLQRRDNFPELQHLSLRKPLRFAYAQLRSDRKGDEFHPVYDLIVGGRYRSVTIESLMSSGLIKWIVSDSQSAAGWPVPRQFSGVEELIIGNEFTISEELRAALLEWIDDHHPSLAKDKSTDDDTLVQEKQRLLKRFIWYACPQLKTLRFETGGNSSVATRPK